MPNLFIVGAPKSGTSFLYENLKRHPQILMGIKEMHFWASDWHFPKGRMDEAYYFSFFKQASSFSYAGEATVSNLASKNAAKAIYQFNPDARIIIILRNPVDMIYSMYGQMTFNGSEDLPSFEAALEAEKERKNLKRIPVLISGPVEFLYYRELGAYTSQVKRYLDCFGSENVLILWFDDLKNDANKLMDDVYNFLDLPIPVERITSKVNTAKTARFKSLTRFLALRSYWKIQVAKIFIPSRKKRYQFASFLGRINQKTLRQRPMNSDTRAMLLNYFKPEIKSLEKLLDKDLSHWLI